MTHTRFLSAFSDIPRLEIKLRFRFLGLPHVASFIPSAYSRPLIRVNSIDSSIWVECIDLYFKGGSSPPEPPDAPLRGAPPGGCAPPPSMDANCPMNRGHVD